MIQVILTSVLLEILAATLAPLAVALPFACAAESATVFPNAIQGMPLVALCLSGANGGRPISRNDVLTLRYQSQVRRIAASSVFASVIDSSDIAPDPGRQWAKIQSVHQPMRIDRSAAKAKMSISIPERTSPIPAARLAALGDFSKEAGAFSFSKFANGKHRKPLSQNLHCAI